MKITRKQLRKIISEMARETGHAAFVKAFDAAYKQPDGSYRGHPDDPEEHRDELATQIRHASKDIYGMKDHYDLRGKSIEELEDILYDLANSPEQKYMDDEARYEMEDEMGYDSELSGLEKAPKRQGMKRRHAGSKSQRIKENKMKITKRQLRRIIREEKEKLLREQKENLLREETVDMSGMSSKSEKSTDSQDAQNVDLSKMPEEDNIKALRDFAKALYTKTMQGGVTYGVGEDGKPKKIKTNQIDGIIALMKSALEAAVQDKVTSSTVTDKAIKRLSSTLNME